MNGQTDLTQYIEWSSLECLNQKPDKTVANALKQGYREDDGLFLESDTDEQLLIHIPFNQAVKMQSMVVKNSANDGTAPSKVKLFINKPSLGFNEAADFPATQEFTLTERQLQGESVPLRFAKFQNVHKLSIFIEDNTGGEETTKVQRIALFGSAGEVFNVNDIKKVEDGQG